MNLENKMNSRPRILGLLILLLALFATACGSDSDPGAASAATDIATTGDISSNEGTDSGPVATAGLSYQVVDTDQTWCFSGDEVIECGDEFSGQDAQYEGAQPSYQDNGDGTVTDLNTGLMWIQDAGDKTYYADAMEELETYTFAGYDDWRLPTIKELYSLALFSGVDVGGAETSDVDGLWPFIDEDYFVFWYGDETGSNRVIDAQWLSSTIYTATVNGNESCFFGFNFSDGRIKCYPVEASPTGGYFAQYVRGDGSYGVNDYDDNGDGTITDRATGLTWAQGDNGVTYDWEGALNYCDDLSLGGSDEWRLPNIKELHSIVDYERSPDTTGSPAINPLFALTPITNEAGETDWGFYWSSTTFISYPSNVSAATYISFGRALGYMGNSWMDVHGAGAQRSDPKVAGEVYEFGRGPQGDAVRTDNYALCVTGGDVTPSEGDSPSTLQLSDVVLEGSMTGGAPAAANGGGPEVEGPDLAVAAATLGVTQQELMAALGAPPPDFDAAAATLGITPGELRDALGVGSTD